MGTRSLTRTWDTWKDEKGKEHKARIMTMYRQMDGYPEGHGLELAELLKDMIITNGISFMEGKKTANGMDCLSAQIVAYFKDGPGDIYLVRHASGMWEEYIYDVFQNDTTGQTTIVMNDVHGKTSQRFTPQEFITQYSKDQEVAHV
jgi:hypothetical protein